MKKDRVYEFFMPHKSKWFFMLLSMPWYLRYGGSHFLCIAIIVLWLYVFYYPTTYRISQLDQEITVLQCCIEQGEHKKKALHCVQKEYESMRQDSGMGSTLALEKQCIVALERLNLSLLSLEPLILQEDETTMHGIALAFHGAYPNIMRFFAQCDLWCCKKVVLEKQNDSMHVSCIFYELKS